MDTRKINFLGEQAERRIAATKRLKKVSKVLFGVIGVELVLSVSLIGWKINLNRHLVTIEANCVKLEKAIESHRDIESMTYLINSRVKDIESVLRPKDRKISSILSLETNLMTQGFEPRGNLKIGNSDTLQIEGAVPNVFSLGQVKTMMDDYKEKGYFTDYKVASFNRAANGEYQITVSLFLSK